MHALLWSVFQYYPSHEEKMFKTELWRKTMKINRSFSGCGRGCIFVSIVWHVCVLKEEGWGGVGERGRINLSVSLWHWHCLISTGLSWFLVIYTYYPINNSITNTIHDPHDRSFKQIFHSIQYAFLICCKSSRETTNTTGFFSPPTPLFRLQVSGYFFLPLQWPLPICFLCYIHTDTGWHEFFWLLLTFLVLCFWVFWQ